MPCFFRCHEAIHIYAIKGMIIQTAHQSSILERWAEAILAKTDAPWGGEELWAGIRASDTELSHLAIEKMQLLLGRPR